MIAFTGEMSEKCRNYVFKYEGMGTRIIALVFSLVLSIPVIILTIKNDWIWSICIVPLILLVVLSGIRPSKKDYALAIPHRITIENGQLMSSSDKFEVSTTMSKVKKVIDFGDWYHIQLSYPLWSSKFVCEKSLLTDGTLEEFESIFSSKLVKKK